MALDEGVQGMDLLGLNLGVFATGGAHHSIFKLLIKHLDGLPFARIMLMYNMFR